MKIAYLFLVHDNPGLVQRTINRLASPNCTFFIHVDGKANMEEFSTVRGDRVVFLQHRIPVFWGEFSIVEATLLLIREALASVPSYDYLVLLSGSHYPIRSTEYISHFFEQHRGVEFMTLVEVPNIVAGKPLSRLTTIRYPSNRPLLRQAFRVLAKLNLAYRDYKRCFGALKPYAGSQWWALSRGACEYLVNFHDRDARLAEYYLNTFSADEAYLHTILGNSIYRPRMRRELTYIDWTGRGGHPKLIDEAHLKQFEAMPAVSLQDHHGPGELLFARKFSDQNYGLLDRIDAMVQAKEQSAGRTQTMENF
jgi:hypothetical protein